MWAVINHKGEAIAVSDTERGAKQYATRNRYTRVGFIHPISWIVCDTSQKVNGEWRKEDA